MVCQLGVSWNADYALLLVVGDGIVGDRRYIEATSRRPSPFLALPNAIRWSGLLDRFRNRLVDCPCGTHVVPSTASRADVRPFVVGSSVAAVVHVG